MEQIKQIITQAGVPCFGVCSFDAVLPLLPCRAANRLPGGAKSVLVCLFPYYVGDFPTRNLSRYAIVDDYHLLTRALLEKAAEALRKAFPEHSFESFVDSSPVREVQAGYLAGLGFIGKNGQLITEGYGSYCFIGEIITTLELPAASPSRKNCGRCNLCQNACPNGAIGERGAIDTAKCRSHITQKKGELTAFEQQTIKQGGFVWGCDICTDICPYNRSPKLTPLEEFYRDIVHTLTEENLYALCKTRAFGWRGAGVLERNLQLTDGHSQVR
ncbi:QueG-associated DUF1730 domain-containing protein [Hydrogenoanaerobacterium sp.]|uniref:epoxyqueuosine reductase n=1 Tax=Hydrogenoanaerobacterium sp. TaxID=2953763 RepID=UPI0028972700|nr:QueG-associated DUF1730 domain-containing protein [Hydrogenoanaerobacterium sp.]